MHNEIRKHIRKRRRAEDIAVRIQNQKHWNKYKHQRNKSTDLLGKGKKQLSQKLANKRIISNFTTTDYWKVLKQFITQQKTKHRIPTLNETAKLYLTELKRQFF